MEWKVSVESLSPTVADCCYRDKTGNFTEPLPPDWFCENSRSGKE